MKKNTLLIVVLFMLSINNVYGQWQRSLLGVFVKSLVKGFGSELGKDLYGKGEQKRLNDLAAQYPELEARMNRTDQKLGQLESSLYDVNSRVSILDTRISKLESRMPYGAFGLGFSIGDFNQNPYKQFQTLSTINMGSASVGLFLNLHTINPPVSPPLERDKIEFKNILSYARFGSEEGKVHVSFGAINTSSFGNSFLFRNYSNDILYNDRQMGFKAGIKHSFIGVEMMSSNLTENRLKASRVFARPFSTANTEVPLALTNIGYNYVVDTDISGEKIEIQAFDTQIPLILQTEKGQHTFVNLFGNYAMYNNYGNGFGVGISTEYSKDGIGLGFWYEYRKLDKKFISGFFDPFYEIGRYQRTRSSLERLRQATEARNEQSIGAEVRLKYLTISGYYISDIKDNSTIAPTPKNVAHLQAALNIPIPIGDNAAKLVVLGSIDKRKLASLEDFNFSELFNNYSFDSIFSLSSSLNIPIGEDIDLFGKYSYRDFLNKNSNNSLQKINNSIFQFGLQYNWGGR
jgi:hypothetical protein